MANVPSIKGSVYVNVHEDANKLLAAGAVSRAEAKRWLEPGDLELLAATVNLASWYDIRSYDRLNRLLCDVEGGGRHDYLREKGRATAKKLIAMGLYSQMEYLQRTEVMERQGAKERFEAFGRDLRKLNTLSASILNFTQWRAAPDPDAPRKYVIEVSEAAEMPETLVWRTDGFVNEMAKQHSADDLWSWRRASRDRIVYTMKREI